MTSTALQIDDLSVRPGGKTILAVDHLDVPSGQMLALLGPNGAGKSTLLRTLLAVQAHAKGTVRVLGESVLSAGSKALARVRSRIGYVPQLLPARSEIPLTVREVVALGRVPVLGLFRRAGADDRDLVDSWIERLGLEHIARTGFAEISGGEQRKTLIARAMVQQPELLLLDEPTANLDLGWREVIVRTIDELYRQTDLTVLLVCHELEVLPESTGRVVLLQSGRVIQDGPADEVLAAGRVESLYGRGLDVIRRGRRWAVVPAGRDGDG